MKRILILIIGLIGVAYGQSSPTSAKTRFVNGLYVGTKLDAYFNAADSNAIYWRADSALMAKYKGTARALAFAVSGGYIPYSDTTTLFSQVVRTFGTQTVGGNKTFSNDIVVNGLTAGRGSGSISTNTAFGSAALTSNTIGANITAIGRAAGSTNTTGSNNTYIGALSAAGGVSNTNETVIGASATGNGSNTVTIGNSSVTGNYFNGFLKQTSVTSALVKASATGQFEAAVAGTDYAPAVAGGYLPLSGGTLTGALSGTSLSMSGQGTFTDAANTYSLIAGGNSSTPNRVVLGTISDGTPNINGYTNGFGAVTKLALQANGGNVLIKTTTDNGTDALQVAGSGLFTGNLKTTGSLISEKNEGSVDLISTSGSGKNWRILSGNDGNMYFQNATAGAVYPLIINGTSSAATFSSSVTATSLIKSGGTSTQALIADGSVQTLTSGTYTPTFTNTTNLTSNADDGVAFYSRVGNTVTVTVRRLVTPTTASINTELTFTLPIASSSTPQGIGHGIYYQGGGTQSAVGAVFMSSSTEAKFQFTCPSGAAGLQNRTIFSFQYQVN